LHPHGDVHGAWECRECLRAFGVKFLGLLSPAGTPAAPTTSTLSTDEPRSAR
jgi:hypothetical protein